MKEPKRSKRVALILAGLLVIVAAAPAVVFVLGHHLMTRFNGLSSGDQLPEAELLTLDGEIEDTGLWRGSPHLLVLFQADCHACHLEARGLTAAQRLHPELAVLRISLLSLDEPEKAREFRRLTGVPFQILTDPSGAFLARVRKLAVPTVYLVDPEGLVTYLGIRPGGAVLEAQRLLSHLESMESVRQP